MTADRWRLVKELLQAAQERRPEERGTFLAGACAGDAALRHEVESLLLVTEQADGFLEPPALAGGISWIDGGGVEGGRTLQVGPYRLVRQIGWGGMAAVYLAVRDDGEYRKEVAVKLVHPGFASDYIVSRFRQERQILAGLDHPNIARLLDGGTADGLPYLVMEYVDGSPIDEHCNNKRLSLTRRLELFCEVCSAVSYAHQRSVIHRDLKPSNVLVNVEGHPKLLDFGIAKLLDGSQRVERTLTAWRLMTPEYASPEQVRGDPVDARTDVYALGVLLYRLVTGRSPYRIDTARPHELAKAICEDEPEAPSVVSTLHDGLRSERQLNGELDAIAMKALAKEPTERYPSVEEFASDVRRYLARIPVSARTPGVARRTWKFVQQHRAESLAPALFVAGVMLAIVVGSAARNAGSSRPVDDRPVHLRSLTTLAESVSAPTFSPDGKFIAFAWTGEGKDATGKPGIYTVTVAGDTPRRLTSGVGGEGWPAWSPDGSQIAFVRGTPGESGIFVVPAAGGPERKLLDLRDDRYYWLAWTPDGKHLAFADRRSVQDPHRLSLLSLASLERHELTSSLDARQSVLRFAFSPDGTTLALITGGTGLVDVVVLSVESGKTRVLYSQKEWIGGLAWTADGQALVVSLNQHGTRRLGRIPVESGRLELLPQVGEDTYYPAISPRGDLLAFVREVTDTDLWRIEVRDPPDPPRLHPLISSTRADSQPVFSPDGKRIAFQSNRSGSTEIWVSDTDGSNQVQLTAVRGVTASWPRWFPDGRRIAFWAGELLAIAAEGGPAKRLAAGGELAAFSADGKWVYFPRGVSSNIWKAPAQGGEAVQVTTNGGSSARESADGRHLYYMKLTTPGIWRMPVSGGREMRVIDDLRPDLVGYWEVVENGIYFVDAGTSPYPTLEFFAFANGQTSRVAMLAGHVVPWAGGLTVSPDNRSILYTQRMYERSEIILVENFR